MTPKASISPSPSVVVVSQPTPINIISVKKLKNVSIAVILVKFTDTGNDPYPKTDIESKLLSSSYSVKNYFESVSYQQWSLEGDVHGWYTIPFQIKGVCGSLDPNNSIQAITNLMSEKWAPAAENLAQKDKLNLSSYSNLVFVFPPDHFECAAGGWHVLGSNKSFIIDPNTSVIIHELGHAFGLDHAKSLSCNGKQIDSETNCNLHDYGDPADVMGGYELAFSSTAGPQPHFNAPHKIALGWLTGNQVQTVDKSGTYTIYPLEQTTPKDQVIKIKRLNTTGDPKEYYYLEYRQPLDFFDKVLPYGLTTGISIRVWNGIQNSAPKLIDTTPGSCVADPFKPNSCPNNQGDFSDAALSDGKVFSDESSGFSVKQINHDASSVKVTIDFTK